MTVQDRNNPNIHFVLVAFRPAGYVEQFAPREWKAFDKEGQFLGWFTSKRAAVAEITK